MRIFANRTRATSFVAMMLAPAAMFAMFFYLSLFIQQVMGFSPLEAGFAFLPFSFGIVLGAGLASNLVSRIDPRCLAGTGTLLAASRCSCSRGSRVDDSPTAILGALGANESLGTGVNYWTTCSRSSS